VPTLPSLLCFAAAAFGLLLAAAQHLALRRHLREPSRAPRSTPPISILKPLCGLDDGLAQNLAAFAALDYPGYEVVLGLRSASDAALPTARAAVQRWPGRFRLVFQRGEPGTNPKVNQLLTLARAARHDVLVISDSNVRVGPDYLLGIAAALDDEDVGLVTHPIAASGERRLGSTLDNLHLMTGVTPGVVGAKRLCGHDFVVGKSMALRRRDLEAMGGFEAVKDVLAEDWRMGTLVSSALGKRVAVAQRPIENVSARRGLREFASRHARWSVLQRQAVGRVAYSGQLLLNPVLLACAGAVLQPGLQSAMALGAVCCARAVIDGASVALLRPEGLRLRQLALVPLKDLVVGAAWCWGLVRRDVAWRGNRILVGPGTRIELPEAEPLEAAQA